MNLESELLAELPLLNVNVKIPESTIGLRTPTNFTIAVPPVRMIEDKLT